MPYKYNYIFALFTCLCYTYIVTAFRTKLFLCVKILLLFYTEMFCVFKRSISPTIREKQVQFMLRLPWGATAAICVGLSLRLIQALNETKGTSVA